ncbi:ribonuclease M5 [Bacillus ectoiniformans]|uniref:ribonuclease M5 n=1 Tax=Bacillus ectoiniformans TaxID=1494429 RepID=UPI00195D84B4|nr:ribonuclease M5 [Bacillus ectoiniformans]MBM7650313.1 ribonuclease M5 [Bacillus ectoiniformans]
MKIKEIIVVEGKDDTVTVKRAVEADTLETNGSAISPATIERIKLAQQKRGVIVFTDPDYPGERIRKIISDHVPNCKHAFLPKHQALHKRGKGVGVEHASIESIREALKEAQLMETEAAEQISKEDLVDAGLIGGSKAKERRESLGEKLKIGYTNGKQLHKRLLMFQITREQFRDALIEVLQEENQ